MWLRPAVVFGIARAVREEYDMRSIRVYVTIVALAGLLLPAGLARAESKAQRQFERAYFLETHEGDLQAAADLYETVTADRKAAKALRSEAQTRRQCCLEDLGSRDLARLMPPEVVGFVELRQPGRHFENLAEMLGLIGDPLSNLTGGGQRIPIPDAPGIAIPAEVFLSPALIGEVKRFRGLAVAVTGIEPPPAGNPALGGVQAILVLHPGDDRGLRGLIETAAQFVQPTDPIAGFGTVRIEPGVFVTFTNRLVIAATSRDLVADVVERLTSPPARSLADRDDIKAMAEQRGNALLFAFVDAKGSLAAWQKIAQHEPDAAEALGIAYGLLDIAHMQSLALSLGSSPEGLFGEFRMTLDEGHANFVYNLIRTPPMTGRSLKGVPAGAAAVLGLGINPASKPADAELAMQKADKLRYVTGLDLGRELFANIEEISVFIVPGERRSGGLEIPDFGVVITAADPVKSQQLWDYLLGIPSRIMGQELAEPTTKRIAGAEVRLYPMPEGPTIHIAQVDHSLLVAPNEAALVASIEAFRTGESILSDPGVKEAVSQITEDTSLVLFAHAGRCAQVGAQFCPPDEVPIVRAVGAMLESTMLTLVADESPTRLRLAGRLTGLPKVKDIISLASEMMGLHAGAGPCSGSTDEHHHGEHQPRHASAEEDW